MSVFGVKPTSRIYEYTSYASNRVLRSRASEPPEFITVHRHTDTRSSSGGGGLATRVRHEVVFNRKLTGAFFERGLCANTPRLQVCPAVPGPIKSSKKFGLTGSRAHGHTNSNRIDQVDTSIDQLTRVSVSLCARTFCACRRMLCP